MSRARQRRRWRKWARYADRCDKLGGYVYPSRALLRALIRSTWYGSHRYERPGATFGVILARYRSLPLSFRRPEPHEPHSG